MSLLGDVRLILETDIETENDLCVTEFICCFMSLITLMKF